MRQKRIAIYARVSTNNGQQNPDMQLQALRGYCEARRLKVYKEYVDEGISGAKASRPSLNAMMDDAKKRKFDVVIVWKFDRFARSTKHLITALDEFQNLGIDFISYSENIDTSTPMGKAMFTIVGAIAELERSLICERVKAGLEAAKKRGKKLGRPGIPFNRNDFDNMILQGHSIYNISKLLNIPATTAYRYARSTNQPMVEQ